MNTRTLNSIVRFRHKFTLNGIDGVQEPGDYRIQRYEVLLDIVSRPVFRHVSTSIELHGQPPGIVRTATIDPHELDDALARDAAGGKSDAIASKSLTVDEPEDLPK